MTTIYKLTDANMQTHGGFQWALGETRTASGEGELCGDGWLHGYEDPHIGVIMNPHHGNFDAATMLMFEGVAGGERKDDRGLKCGYTELTLVKEIDVPVISTEHRVAFAILCAKRVYKDEAWTRWAERWLSGEDRSEAAARAAWDAVWAAVSAAEAASAADLAARAAEAAAEAAEAAAWAAAWAATWMADLDLVAIFEEARQYVERNGNE